jgi:hypothetical protein
MRGRSKPRKYLVGIDKLYGDNRIEYQRAEAGEMEREKRRNQGPCMCEIEEESRDTRENGGGGKEMR